LPLRSLPGSKAKAAPATLRIVIIVIIENNVFLNMGLFLLWDG
jgi:hypothetical protein